MQSAKVISEDKYILDRFDYYCDFNNKLAFGCCGSIYKGEYRNQTVAVKVIYNEHKKVIALREAQIMKIITEGLEKYAGDKANTACLVKYFGHHAPHEDSGLTREDNDIKNCIQISFVMEYANSGTLNEWMYWDPVEENSASGNAGNKKKIRKTRFEYNRTNAYPVVKHVMTALDILHGMGVVHSDVRSENVLLHENYGQLQAKLCDFGNAHLESESSELEFITTTERETWECDIASFGWVLIGMLRQHTHFEKRQGLIQNCPQQKLAKLVSWCWEKDKNKYPTSKQCLEQLQTPIDEISPELNKYSPASY